MTTRTFAFAAALLCASSPALSQGFSCRNQAAEIRCAGGRCEVETESFTPMQLTLTRRFVTLCAYSGCWEGRVDVNRGASGVRFLQAHMRRIGSGDGSESSLLSVMFSPASATAQLDWNGFQSVLECGSETRIGVPL